MEVYDFSAIELKQSLTVAFSPHSDAVNSEYCPGFTRRNLKLSLLPGGQPVRRQRRFKPDNLIPNTRDLSAAHRKLILVQSAINKNLFSLSVLRRTETGEFSCNPGG